MVLNQVTAPSWLNDSRDQVEQTRVLIVVYCHAAAMGSRLPSIASAKAGLLVHRTLATHLQQYLGNMLVLCALIVQRLVRRPLISCVLILS